MYRKWSILCIFFIIILTLLVKLAIYYWCLPLVYCGKVGFVYET